MDSGIDAMGSGIGAAALRGRFAADLRAFFALRAGRLADLRLAPFLARAGAALRLAPLRDFLPPVRFALRFAFLGIRPSIGILRE